MAKRRSRSPLKKLRLRRNNETPDRVIYEIIKTPPSDLKTVAEELATSATPKTSKESASHQPTTSKDEENVSPRRSRPLKVPRTIPARNVDDSSTPSGSPIAHSNRMASRKTVYKKVLVDQESVVERFARFGLEKEASESDSDEPTPKPVSKKTESHSKKCVVTKLPSPMDNEGGSESSQPSKSPKKKKSRPKKAVISTLPEDTEMRVESPDLYAEALEPVKKAPKKRASRAKKQKSRAPSPVDVEMRSGSLEPAMRSASIDALLPPLSVLQSMTPAEWIPRAVSEPRDNVPEVAKASSPLNLSEDVALDQSEEEPRRSSLRLPELPELTAKPMSPKLFSFANLALTHDAPLQSSQNTGPEVSQPSNLDCPTALMQSLSLETLTRDPEIETVPIAAKVPESNAKPEASASDATPMAPSRPKAAEPTDSPTPMDAESNENLPPASAESPRDVQPASSQPRLTSKVASNRKIHAYKLEELAEKCDQENPGPPKLCPSGMGRIRLEPMSKTNAPVFVEMTTEKFQRLMPKLPGVPLASKRR